MGIRFNHYNFTYALNDKLALQDVELDIQDGEILTLCGASGSGKSTLLRSLKKAVTPAGTATGHIEGLPNNNEVAIVFQNPETQLLTAVVLDDLVFQMENRAMDRFVMKKRLSETVSFFGLEPLLHKPTHTLSGGQKQIVALCAALMCEPRLLLLDEPVSQLDPLACVAFMETLRRINTDLGITIVIAEHRLDECVHIASRIAYLENGAVAYAGETSDALRFLFERNPESKNFVPELPKASLYLDGRVALTTPFFRASYKTAPHRVSVEPVSQDAGASSTQYGRSSHLVRPASLIKKPPMKPAVQISDIILHYPETDEPVLNRLNFSCLPGELLCLLGGNGSGKTSLLKVMARILKPAGSVKINARQLGYMPQQVRDYFIRDRVADEIHALDSPYTQSLIARLDVGSIMDKHPFDISGGEQQKVVLLALLSQQPDLILLDEPTKGMDPAAKQILAEILRETGAAVIVATHDLTFAAESADRCAMLFDGEIAYSHAPRPFFAGNRYYTTAIHKALGHIDENAVVFQDVFTLWDIKE